MDYTEEITFNDIPQAMSELLRLVQSQQIKLAEVQRRLDDLSPSNTEDSILIKGVKFNKNEIINIHDKRLYPAVFASYQMARRRATESTNRCPFSKSSGEWCISVSDLSDWFFRQKKNKL